MSTKSVKVAAVTGILVVAAVAAYWYWSPFLAVQQLQRAAQERDADAFNERVDYPKLRESFKGQFSAMMSERLGDTANSGNGFAALGAMLGMAMADRMIDALVRPETMMRAMQNGQLSPGGKQPTEGTPSYAGSQGTPNDAANHQKDKPKWTYERKSADRLIAYAIDPDKPDFQTSRLPDFQTSRLPDFQTSRLPDFQTSRLAQYAKAWSRISAQWFRGLETNRGQDASFS